MKSLVFQSVVYKEGNHYVAQCLNIDISSFGDNEDQALANLQEALELYYEDTSQLLKTEVDHPTLHTFRLEHA